MKRTISESDTPAAEIKAYRRQLPVSCSFCRNKKLKCDREQPCSNCVARNIQCTNAVSGKSVGPLNHHGHTTPEQTHPSLNDDILARLERLERNVFTSPSHSGGNEVLQAGILSSTATSFEQIQHQPTGWSSLNGAIPTKSKGYETSLVTGHHDRLKPPAIVRLKSSAVIPAPPAVQDLSQLMLRTSRYEAFLLGNQDGNANDVLSSDNSRFSHHVLRSRLPEERTAQALMTHFIDHVIWSYHIIHAPTLQKDMQDIYQFVSSGIGRVNIAKLALLATCLAAVIHCWKFTPDTSITEDQALACRREWMQLAEEAISQSKHDVRPCIETLQSIMISANFLPPDPKLARYTSLETIMKSAKTMGLHQLDSRRNCERRMHSSYDVIDLEIKRRVWWHIVYSDWMLSYMSGSQESTYLCHQLQMNVLQPTNTDDCYITTTKITHILPLNRPTEVSYFTTNYWFASLIRSFTDLACSTGLEVDELEYDQVLLLDAQINKFIKELPFFFQLDDISKARSTQIDAERPYIAWQREMLHFGIHTRLSRLHRPFLTRGYKDPKYAYSRMICLRSARSVIELEQSMRLSNNSMHSQSTCRLWIVVHHVFMATVTLVMDYCINRDDPRAEDRRREILDCYSVLEMGKAGSDIARKGLEHLKRVMSEWRSGTGQGSGDNTPGAPNNSNNLPSQSNTIPASPLHDPNRPSTPTVPPTTQPPPPYPLENRQIGVGLGSILGSTTNHDGTTMELSQDLWLGPDAFEDAGQWDSLFYELDNQVGTFGMSL